MTEELKVAAKKMTKMRFVVVGDKLKQKQYISSAGHLTSKILLTKLNMQPIYGNFKNDITKRIKCELCDDEEDTTEHLLQCRRGSIRPCLEVELLKEDENIDRWRIMIEMVEANFQKRKSTLKDRIEKE